MNEKTTLNKPVLSGFSPTKNEEILIKQKQEEMLDRAIIDWNKRNPTKEGI